MQAEAVIVLEEKRVAARMQRVGAAALRHPDDRHHRIVARRIAPEKVALLRAEAVHAREADRHLLLVVVQVVAVEVDALSVAELRDAQDFAGLHRQRLAFDRLEHELQAPPAVRLAAHSPSSCLT